jgi:transcription initiation factor TFIIIB Brf1 subunit/transcription initiation factor TFIIB
MPLHPFSFVTRQEYVSVLACRHRHPIWDYDDLEVVCSDCGMVLGPISFSPLEHFRWLWGLKDEK